MTLPAVLALVVGAGWTQTASDTLHLAGLQAAALAHDARAGQEALLGEALALQLKTLAVDRLPEVRLLAEGVHQSAVPELPALQPGLPLPTAPRTRYQAAVVAEQRLYDGGLRSRLESVERARYDENRAEVKAALHSVRSEVTAAFFGALLLEVAEGELRQLLGDLQSRLDETRVMVEAGAAVPADTAAIEAERLLVSQALDEVVSDRAATLAVLSGLAGFTVTTDAVLAVPELEGAVASAVAGEGASTLVRRPDLERLTQTAARIDREAETVAARERPQLSLFGQVGVGRPGPFELFDDDLNPFWSAGLRLQWQPWSWRQGDRERDLLRVRREVVETEHAALVARIERQVAPELRAIARLEATREQDERIVALREQVERQAALQRAEGVLTTSQYLAARTDLFEARLRVQRHRVELEHARARYLDLIAAEIER